MFSSGLDPPSTDGLVIIARRFGMSRVLAMCCVVEDLCVCLIAVHPTGACVLSDIYRRQPLNSSPRSIYHTFGRPVYPIRRVMSLAELMR